MSREEVIEYLRGCSMNIGDNDVNMIRKIINYKYNKLYSIDEVINSIKVSNFKGTLGNHITHMRDFLCIEFNITTIIKDNKIINYV